MSSLVISDLHLFSRRSQGDELLKNYLKSCQEPEVLVLNGDTFDFRWSDIGDEDETLSTAEAWLNQLIGSLPNTRIHYILGNHDCLRVFRDRLESIERLNPRFHLHEYWLSLGPHFFLHGDCANWGMSPAKLERYRESWSTDRPKGELSKKLYRLVDTSGIGAVFHHLYFRRKATVSRILRYLKRAAPEELELAEHIYFGHSHVPFHNHSQDNFTFHNTGSGVTGMGFLPKEF